MEPTQEQYERIEEYLLGKMTEKDQLNFEIELLLDEKMRQELEEVSELTRTIEWSMLRNSAAELSREKQRRMEKKELTNRLIQVVGIVIALSAVLFTWWYFVIATPTTNTLFRQYYRPDHGLAVKASEVKNPQLSQALQLYAAHHYSKALPIFTDLLKEDPKNDTLEFFTGNILLAQGEISAAQKAFEEVSHPGVLKEKSLWYLTLIEIKNNDLNAAGSKLAQILQDPASAGYENAHSLNKRLKKLTGKP